jgi:hypothetical protein
MNAAAHNRATLSGHRKAMPAFYPRRSPAKADLAAGFRGALGCESFYLCRVHRQVHRPALQAEARNNRDRSKSESVFEPWRVREEVHTPHRLDASSLKTIAVASKAAFISHPAHSNRRRGGWESPRTERPARRFCFSASAGSELEKNGTPGLAGEARVVASMTSPTEPADIERLRVVAVVSFSLLLTTL